MVSLIGNSDFWVAVAGLQVVAGSGYSWRGDSPVTNGKVVLGASRSWDFPGVRRDFSSPLAFLSLPAQQCWDSIPNFPLTKSSFCSFAVF